MGCVTLQQFFLHTKRGGGPKAARGNNNSSAVVDKLKNYLDPEYKFSQRYHCRLTLAET
jgi:hypothetical protein